MMTTGIIRRIDDLGRIVIPKEIRRVVGIKEGDPLEIGLNGRTITLDLYFPTYDHGEHIKRLIELLKEDDFLIEKEEYREARRKAIDALKDAYIALVSTNKNGQYTML